MDKKQIEERKAYIKTEGLEIMYANELDLIAHIERLETENANYKAVVEKIEWVLLRSRRFDNHIGISFEDCNELYQALQAVKEEK